MESGRRARGTARRLSASVSLATRVQTQPARPTSAPTSWEAPPPALPASAEPSLRLPPSLRGGMNFPRKPRDAAGETEAQCGEQPQRGSSSPKRPPPTASPRRRLAHRSWRRSARVRHGAGSEARRPPTRLGRGEAGQSLPAHLLAGLGRSAVRGCRRATESGVARRCERVGGDGHRSRLRCLQAAAGVRRGAQVSQVPQQREGASALICQGSGP